MGVSKEALVDSAGLVGHHVDDSAVKNVLCMRTNGGLQSDTIALST